ncbi:helix-turn-helix domain-containing protein [Streptomyces sp. SPB074]|uniref:helix-turn-helix domain-containing protein n=1 Tax=Streptomyces sp. (strain SPB074) TaxID=465543 RepID=UPI00017F1037|nr:helix-turn-helix transcriptional regulator [Streptomyces sp. SPB074]EDY43259.1 XRE family transcriptional regulator [Streptomyces sp. SPB074]
MNSTASIGDRIRTLRELRDITQEQLAARAEVSVDTVRKLEQNTRQSARITTLRALARALDVQLERLVGQPTVSPQLSEDGGLLALRDSVQALDALPGVSFDADEDAPAERAFSDAVATATLAYWKGEYAQLSSTLPMLLRDGRAAAREHGTELVWSRLALAYQLAASLSVQSGHPDWAFAAVERQLDAAHRASDPLLEGMAVSTLSWVLLRQGRWEQAATVAERKADELEPSFRRATPSQYAVYGNLLIAAATPTARHGDQDVAQQMLTAAEAAAVRSGPVRAYGSAFSVTDVRTQRVNVALTDPDTGAASALALAAGVDTAAISRPVHSASYRTDVAQAQQQTGDHQGALATLLEVEHDQPEWMRLQPSALATVRELLDAERRRNSGLRGLASRLGVDLTL